MKTVLSLVATSVVLFLATGHAFGQVELSINDVFLTPSEEPQFGSFELLLSHDLAIDPSLAGFQAVLELSSISSAAPGRFLDVQTPIEFAYALEPFSSAPVGAISTDGNVAQIGDFLLQDSAILSGSEIFSLGRINFEIPGNTLPGDQYRIDFRVSPDETFLASGLTGRFPISTNGAVIQVVPEPSSTMPLTILLSIALIKLRRNRVVS